MPTPSVLVRTFFWVVDLSLYLSVAESRARKQALSWLIRALIPSWGPTFMASSDPNCLPKAPLPNVNILGSRVSIGEFWGHTNTQFRAGGLGRTWGTVSL